jgi:Heparinase II/III-like protein/Heparinase II/III N-terminus
MDGAELLDRARQETSKRVDVTLGSLAYEFAAGEVNGGCPDALRFFFTSESVGSVLALLHDRFPKRVEEIVQSAFRCCAHRFDLLGYSDVDYGERIDWHRDPVHDKRAPLLPFFRVPYLDYGAVGDVKIIWELNRHQHFVTLAKAYRLSGDMRFADELVDQWRSWHSTNPYPLGVNWVSSLEVAFRSLSWLWTYFLLAGTPAATQEFRIALMRALALNARHIERYLSTYSSPNTHLLGEAVALFFTGTLCPQFRSAKRWKERGWSIICEQCARQVRDDGMHFEQSTYYHVYALDFLLHSMILASLNGIAIPDSFERRILKMLEFLRTVGEAGMPPRLGDDDGGRVFDPRRNRSEHLLDPLATGAVLFARGDLKHAARTLPEETIWLLGDRGAAAWDLLQEHPAKAASVAFEQSGVHCMVAPSGGRLIINAGARGPLRAGHAHADTLSITLSENGKELLVDAGTFSYVQAGGRRAAFRGTPAHNTLQVDGRDQGQPDGAFAWTSFPRSNVEAWITGKHFDFFSARHDGYGSLEEGIVHRRDVFSMRSAFWFVRDVADGKGEHHFDQYWHLGPALHRQDAGTMTFRATDGCGVALVVPEDCPWDAEVRAGWWSPAYGAIEPALIAHFSALQTAPAELAVAVVAMRGPNATTGTLESVELQCDRALHAYRYRAAYEDYLLCFGDGGEWRCGQYASDATFACVARISETELILIFCNGTFVDIDGHRIVQCARNVDRCEVQLRGRESHVHTSDPDAIVIRPGLQGIGV